eukprot:TRINITY_DN62724_c0_g2_i1.p1 TRINITY_DN62724_c0_g2~~TRINITY_DN62724_c0_g2_i1.p1  ORF type:complete len:271 (+),score=39.16 TRINITY_DN62724_c0_g2_i1:38-850(+)
MARVPVLFLFFFFAGCHCQGSCVIQNYAGQKTDLSGVVDHTWMGPDKPGGTTMYQWSLNPCHQSQGVCKMSQYKAYLQQYGPGGCPGNAYFQTYSSGTGGQGGNIYLTYQGNPTTHTPIEGREGHVVLKCDPTGSYSTITDCTVDVTNTGYNFVYTVQCNSKIACAGAPGPSPPPSPSPPPHNCSCYFGMFEGSTNCMGHKGIEGVTGGGRCDHFTDSSGNHFSVATGGRCRDFNLYKGIDCANGFIGQYPVNHCNTTKMDSSVSMFCPP